MKIVVMAIGLQFPWLVMAPSQTRRVVMLPLPPIAVVNAVQSAA